MPITVFRRRRPAAPGLLLALLLALSWSVAAAQEAQPDQWEVVWEHWYTLELAGATAGWMHQTVSVSGT